MNRFSVMILSVLLLAVVITPGCVEKQEQTTTAPQPQSIKLGSILPLTGDLSVYGQSVRNGAEMAVSDINSAGGINGKDFSIVYEDNKGAATDTVTAFHKLTDVDGVPVVFGAIISTNTLAIAPLAREKSVVLISPTATSPKLSQYEDGYFFRVISSDAYQGIAMANLTSDLGYKEVAVAYINNEYGAGFADVFKTKYTDLGGKILETVPYDEGKTDFRSEITKLKAAQPEATIIIGYVKEASIIFRQSKELGFKTQWLGSEGLKSDDLINQSAGSAEGILVTFPAVDPGYDRFKSDHRARYGTEPGIFSEYGYDMVMVAAEAMSKAGNDTESIRNELRKLDYTGPSGHKKFDKFGDVATAYDVWVIKNGSFEISRKAG